VYSGPNILQLTFDLLKCDGKIFGISVFGRDITEYKRAQQELRRSQEELRSVLASISDFLWSADIDSQGHVTYRYYSPVVKKITGRAPEFYLPGPERWLSTVHPDDRLRVQATMARIRTAKLPLMTEEYRIVLPDGTVRWVRDSVQLRRENGLIRADGVVSNITESKRAEEALHESEERYRRLFEAESDAILVVEVDTGKILDANAAAFAVYGYSREELLSLTIAEISAEPEKTRSTLAEQQESVQLRRHRKKDGIVFPVEITGNYFFRQGRKIHVVAIRDVTERERAEQEHRRSLDQLRALAARLQSVREEERKRVAREIHDQLGQALTAIKIELSSLARGLAAGEKHLSEKSSSILKLVDESIHAVRRISTDLRPGILDDLGLAAAIEWASEDFQARTGTTCSLDLPKDEIVVDPERATAIFRIFQETLTNIARHADASEVAVRLADEGGDLTLEVHDNGKGIPGEKLRANASLGILGMRERAILLGGELNISSAPSGGTTVKVKIPEARSIE
jgi:PAS domain S-box-containing protein